MFVRPISEIDEFPDHPFKVLMNEDMEQLVESVSRSGVMTPATVRQKEDGRYELLLCKLFIGCGYFAAFVVGKNALALCGGF